MIVSSVPPSSQKAEYRPISFVLDDQAAGDAPVTVNLAIRPEDLTRSDPSRLNVQQTLGGAWGDNFGPGVPQITISGTTGWRRGAADGLDGSERFTQLYEQVYTGWHQRRRDAVAAGLDPDLVQLVFADALDNFAVVVAPNNFVLRRSKTRPLLFQYQIAMTVLDQNIDQLAYLQYGGGFLDADVTQQLGISSLSQSLTDLAGFMPGVGNFVPASIATSVTSFLTQANGVFNQVSSAVTGALSTIVGPLISVAQTVARAGINVFRTLASGYTGTTAGLANLLGVVGALTNIWCVLNNALNLQIYVPDFSSLFGSSNCSSTNGGLPISVFTSSGVNPFYSVVPTPTALPVQLTQSAQNNLMVLASNDPVLSPMSTSSLGASLAAVTSGLSISV